jgi:hypothetical protein
MMRKMSGRKWGGIAEEEREEGEEDEEQEEKEEESTEYGRWVRNLTRELEEEVEKGGAGTKWEEEAVRRKFAWTGHMIRRGQERRTARVVEATEESLRRARRGFPTTRWDDTFKQILGDAWQGEAQQREQWRFWTDRCVETLSWI